MSSDVAQGEPGQFHEPIPLPARRGAGGRPLRSDPGDQSSGATKLVRQIDQARDIVLARHGWTCALEYVTLQPAQHPQLRQLALSGALPAARGLPEGVGDRRAWCSMAPRAAGRPAGEVGNDRGRSGSPQKIIRASPIVLGGGGAFHGATMAIGQLERLALEGSTDPAAQIMGDPDALQLGPLNVGLCSAAPNFGALDAHVGSTRWRPWSWPPGRRSRQKEHRADAAASRDAARHQHRRADRGQPALPLAPSSSARLRAHARRQR